MLAVLLFLYSITHTSALAFIHRYPLNVIVADSSLTETALPPFSLAVFLFIEANEAEPSSPAATAGAPFPPWKATLNNGYGPFTVTVVRIPYTTVVLGGSSSL